MTDATAEFFDSLARREHEPLLEKTSGSLRFDLVDGDQTEHWLVSIDKGDVAVSRKSGKADCVVRAPKELFDGILRGEVNAMAAVLRGAVLALGNPNLLTRFQRLLPSPPSQRSTTRSAGAKR
jgi:putative sterol carrier protein